MLKLRVDVFVVEQRCAYAELDGLDTDRHTLHALAWNKQFLAGYARALAPETADSSYRIGRVVVHPEYRKLGAATELMVKLMSAGAIQWPSRPIELSAQTTALSFYQSLGFVTTSEEYLEDGIEHIDMRYNRQA